MIICLFPYLFIRNQNQGCVAYYVIILPLIASSYASHHHSGDTEN